MKNQLLSTENLEIGYLNGKPDRKVVGADLNLELFQGELVCLVGPNGAGKSTLLKTLTGLLPALSGSVSIGGKDLKDYHRKELANEVSVVLTSPVQVGAMTVRDLVAMGRFPFTGLFDRMDEHDWEMVALSMKMVGLDGFEDRMVHKLSDGERQRVMIARALAQEPRLLVLDEPTAFLDLPSRVVVMNLLRDLACGHERAVLTSSHDLDLALRHADRIWLMDEHGVIRQGAPEDLVLNGSFAQTFNRRGVSFDPTSGTFNSQSDGSSRVVLHGQGAEFIWTKRALQRAGYAVEKEAKTGCPVVRITQEGESYQWQLDCDGKTQKFLSIYELISAL